MTKTKSSTYIVLSCVLLLTWGCLSKPKPIVEDSVTTQINDICFSSQASIRDYIVSKIELAKDSLNIINFKFDSKEIADALIKAHKRGVKIKVLVDIRSEFQMTDSLNHKYPFSTIDYLHSNGITIGIIDIRPSILHQKIILTDDKYISFGSANFYNDDLNNNYEFFITISDSVNYGQFKDNFYAIWNKKNADYKFRHIKNNPNDSKTSILTLPPYQDDVITKASVFNHGKHYDIPDYLIDVINNAKDSIHVIASIFEYKPIFKMLLNANRKGVKVKILANRISEDFLSQHYNNNIEIKIFNSKDHKGMMHSKTILIDGKYILCGSVNLFERSLLKDFEHLVKFESRSLYNKFHTDFNIMWNSNKFISK